MSVTCRCACGRDGLIARAAETGLDQMAIARAVLNKAIRPPISKARPSIRYIESTLYTHQQDPLPHQLAPSLAPAWPFPIRPRTSPPSPISP